MCVNLLGASFCLCGNLLGASFCLCRNLLGASVCLTEALLHSLGQVLQPAQTRTHQAHMQWQPARILRASPLNNPTIMGLALTSDWSVMVE
jgi:hypothetical protein